MVEATDEAEDGVPMTGYDSDEGGSKTESVSQVNPKGLSRPISSFAGGRLSRMTSSSPTSSPRNEVSDHHTTFILVVRTRGQD